MAASPLRNGNRRAPIRQGFRAAVAKERFHFRLGFAVDRDVMNGRLFDMRNFYPPPLEAICRVFWMLLLVIRFSSAFQTKNESHRLLENVHAGKAPRGEIRTRPRGSARRYRVRCHRHLHNVVPHRK